MSVKKEYKKFFVLSILSIFMISIFAGFVSAADSSGFIEGIKGVFGPISNALFGTDGATGSAGRGMVFEAFLFALMIVAVVYAALSRVPLMQDNSFALWTVSIACSVLGTRFMLQNNWLAVVMIPQGVLAISLTVLIPFLVYFWFVELSLKGERYKTVRRICWAVYAVVWTFVWFDQSGRIAGNLEWLYPTSVIVSIAMLFLDGTMQKLFNTMEADRFEEGRKSKALMAYKSELASIKEIYEDDPTNYTGMYVGGGKGKPHGIVAYSADMMFLQKEMRKAM